ncbi:MAG: M48 family metallopeptidase [Candidatus Omnitrophica bacterium]|nr:M48 family metallopeptidase [Candidatus Omnitrophota bacterium]
MKTAENIQNAKKYCRIKHNIALLEMFLTLALLLLIQASGLSSEFKRIALSVSRAPILLIAVYMTMFGIFLSVIFFWPDYYAGYILEHKFSLSKQNFISWLKDYFKRLLIGGVIYLLMLEVLYYFLKNFPGIWWLWVSVIWLFFSLFLAKIFPIFIIPLFYKLQPLEDESLKARLLGLAKKSRVKILDIYRIGLGEKTKKANAALTGMGSSKRILLSDTLLDNYTQDEIEATLAHELAHYKYRHVWKLIIFNLLLTVATFLFIHFGYNYIIFNAIKLNIYDIGAFPALAFLFTVFNIIFIPAYNALSRHFETQADKEAVNVTGKPDAFISLMKKLTEQNLSDPEPSKIAEMFFYDHPPAGKRIRTAGETIKK